MEREGGGRGHCQQSPEYIRLVVVLHSNDSRGHPVCLNYSKAPLLSFFFSIIDHKNSLKCHCDGTKHQNTIIISVFIFFFSFVMTNSFCRIIDWMGFSAPKCALNWKWTTFSIHTKLFRFACIYFHLSFSFDEAKRGAAKQKSPCDARSYSFQKCLLEISALASKHFTTKRMFIIQKLVEMRTNIKFHFRKGKRKYIIYRTFTPTFHSLSLYILSSLQVFSALFSVSKFMQPQIFLCFQMKTERAKKKKTTTK